MDDDKQLQSKLLFQVGERLSELLNLLLPVGRFDNLDDQLGLVVDIDGVSTLGYLVLEICLL